MQLGARNAVFCVVAAVGAMAVAHLPAVGTWARRMVPTVSSCPFGHASTGADSALPSAAPVLPGATAALHRRALGFELAQATRADVSSWARLHGATCRGQRASPSYECHLDEPHRLDPAFEHASKLTVFFRFGADDSLSEIRTLATFHEAERATAALVHHLGDANQQAGVTGQVAGEFTPEYLSAGALRQARAEFRCSDLYVRVSATNYGQLLDVTRSVRLLP